MNPLDWEDAFRTLQRRLDPNHQSGFNNRMETASEAINDWDTYCQYSRYTVDEPQSSTGVNVGWKGLSPSSQNLYINESEAEDPDGEPLQMDEGDPELTRKRKELREIEERIIHKKVAIALKKVEPFVKETPSGFSSNEQSAACKGATLKDRVNVILLQRHPVSFLSKVRSPKERMSSSSRSKDGLLQEDHPLKLRLKSLMKQRCRDPYVLPTNREPPDVPLPPPSRSVTSPAKEKNSVNQGFQRFLSVLNKGVDMDLLSRIVNDDSEDLPSSEELLNIQDKSDPPFRSKSHRSNSGASLLSRCRTNSGERSLSERLSLPNEDKKKKDRGDRCLGSSSRSKSPSAVKRRKEEEPKPKVNEQHEQLQNILKTLGLSLEVEEMSKLADRTQERLYGKKHEGVRADSREEQESQQKGSPRHYRDSSSSSSTSSSSSSSCCSSRSTSRSVSPSPSPRQRSHHRDSKQSLKPYTSERSSSRDNSRAGLKCQDGNQDSKEAQGHRGNDRTDSKETSAYLPSYPQNETYPHPAAFSAFLDYSLSQYSQYSAPHSDTYNAASDSYWSYAQAAIPPSLYPSKFPVPQNTYHPNSVMAPNTVYPRHNTRDVNLLVNPDLSRSEGQTGSSSVRRCLTVISTKQPTQSCLKQLTDCKTRRRGNFNTRRLRWKRKKLKKKQLKMAAKQVTDSVKKVNAPQGNEDEPEAEQSEEEKRNPTEEEIKANLRKKLEAFNQKVKQKVTQPANSITSLTG
ncbi:zinc finger protein 318-like isoform X1 [Micropterus salmoides]|uniref:zinc finger protein 318-like isoform X1 n=1 Tax=Micropterus salmoides TaxID=27706 RepID=UPI0018EBBC8F|nr:zinc finger protein 318-like isoform X1 [Micropterus salmoides]XP_038570384.1 zinc finger protein 318-like isoform X1 [Micropterus salmoides]XP_038570385.1 zinc finger protein 318-like isoform X1 [Micropterus salmoides]XP_038570386.1 zinc finger protein 318-like isoform X1 [Micropterus salmoides]